MGKGISLVYGHGVGDAIARVEHDTRGTTGRVHRQHSLDGDVHGWSIECIEHDLRHLRPIGIGDEGSLSQQDGVLHRGDSQLIVEGVMPDLLHIVPVCDDPTLDRVCQGKHSSLTLCHVTNVAVLRQDILSNRRHHR